MEIRIFFHYFKLPDYLSSQLAMQADRLTDAKIAVG